MRIYLVRHGDAVPEEDAGSDRDRWLSPRLVRSVSDALTPLASGHAWHLSIAAKGALDGIEIVPRPVSRRGEPQRRFAKTLAAVERYREVTQGDEPGAHIVPSPVLARPDQGETVGTPWTRLWARRKGSATE